MDSCCRRPVVARTRQKRAATEAALKLTQAYESDGDGVEIYVWEGSAATCVYPEEGSLGSEEKDR